MARTTTSPLAATALLSLLMIGVPVWLFSRVTSSLLPFQSADLLLLVALAAWLFAAKAILDRDGAVNSATMNRTSPAWHAHRLVDASILGVGFEANSAAGESTPSLYLVTAPQMLSEEQLPPQLPAAEFARGRNELGEAGPRSIPMLHSDEPVAPSVPDTQHPVTQHPATQYPATQEYIVARGDTFWSIAEVVLGDGRAWQELQNLNIGRQVAYDVVLTTNHELRIGWSILLPVSLDDDQAAGHVA